MVANNRGQIIHPTAPPPVHFQFNAGPNLYPQAVQMQGGPGGQVLVQVGGGASRIEAIAAQLLASAAVGGQLRNEQIDQAIDAADRLVQRVDRLLAARAQGLQNPG